MPALINGSKPVDPEFTISVKLSEIRTLVVALGERNDSMNIDAVKVDQYDHAGIFLHNLIMNNNELYNFFLDLHKSNI